MNTDDSCDCSASPGANRPSPGANRPLSGANRPLSDANRPLSGVLTSLEGPWKPLSGDASMSLSVELITNFSSEVVDPMPSVEVTSHSGEILGFNDRVGVSRGGGSDLSVMGSDFISIRTGSEELTVEENGEEALTTGEKEEEVLTVGEWKVEVGCSVSCPE